MAEITYIEAIRQALREEMSRDENVILLGEDIGVYGGAFGATEGLVEEFGEERVIDTPISESLIVGAAIGAALQGMRPVCEMQFADFISCGFDQIVNQAATLRYRHGGNACAPIVVRAPSGASIHGGPFHSQNPEAWFCHQPGLKVVAPATPYDAKGLLKAAIRDDDPVIYFEHKYLYRRAKGEAPEKDYVVPIGEAEVKREGKDVTVIAYGVTVQHSLEVAEKLVEDGIDIEIVDLRTLSPLDRETVLESVAKTNKVVVTHEAAKTGGVGAELSAILSEEAFDHLDAPITRVASHDIPVPFAPPLEEFCLPSAAKIESAIREVVAY